MFFDLCRTHTLEVKEAIHILKSFKKMKKTDYVMEKGTLGVQFKRSVEVNDKVSVLTVEVKLNHKKGLFGISGNWNFDQVSDNEDENNATLTVLLELMGEAKNYAVEWRNAWLGERKENTNQLEIGFGGGSEDDDDE